MQGSDEQLTHPSPKHSWSVSCHGLALDVGRASGGEGRLGFCQTCVTAIIGTQSELTDDRSVYTLFWARRGDRSVARTQARSPGSISTARPVAEYELLYGLQGLELSTDRYI